MSCCEPTIENFFNQSTTTIPYPAFMQEQYGAKPNVEVYYKDGAEYVLSNDMNRVEFDGSTITVDHGGPNTGFIKIY